MKILLFEYFLKRLVEWYCNFYKINLNDFNLHSKNNLSKIKIIKLHFFACSTNEEALDIFNEFYAMPYGHVESEVYRNLNILNNFNVDGNRLQINNPLIDIIGVPAQNHIIDQIVENIKEKNFNLIAIEPFELVELSHSWFSWYFTYGQARKLGSYSRHISPDLIKQEVKNYVI